VGKVGDKWSYLVYEHKKILKNFYDFDEAKEFVDELT
tara:strand:- start:137 stop:247 length:111 start_codon:yes stop_codon:yes gene_type:complete